MSLEASIDNLLSKAIFDLNGELNINDFSISDDFNIRIKLNGEIWDGYIDYRIASFVDKLQRDILNLYNSTTGENISLRSRKEELQPFVIKIKIDEGCTDICIFFKELLTNMMQKMESKHMLVLGVTGLLLASGLLTTSNYFTHVEKMASMAHSTEEKKQIYKIAKAAFEQSKETTTAVHHLISKLEKNDTITFASSKPISKHEAEELFKHTDSIPIEKTYHIDDKFIVTKVDLVNQTISININGKSITATVKLMSETSKQKLCQMVDEGLLKDYAPAVDLQVSAIFLDGTLSEAHCTNIGPKRTSALSYFEVATKKISKQKQPEQHSLF